MLSFILAFFFLLGNINAGTPRPPFDELINRLVSLSAIDNSAKRPAIVSVDIPSGWHVEEGDINGGGFKPDMLVSNLASFSEAFWI